MWAKVSRYGNAVFQILPNFAGLFLSAFSHSRGEVGFCVPCGYDILTIRRCLDARVKALPDGEWRATLRASDVALAVMAKLYLVVAWVYETLRLLPSRVIRTTRFSMIQPLVPEGLVHHRDQGDSTPRASPAPSSR